MLGSAATEREKANQRDPNQRKTGYSSKDVLECYPNVYHLLWDLETLMARRHQALNGIHLGLRDSSILLSDLLTFY